MLKNLFSKKESIQKINSPEADVVLRLMFEIAISDGTLDKLELQLIKTRADKISKEDEKTSSIVKKILMKQKNLFLYILQLKKSITLMVLKKRLNY
jgi:hypothetical protein